MQVGNTWVDCYPLGTDPHGNDMAEVWVDDFKANVLITVTDIFITKPDFGLQGYYWLPYAPVDHDPMPQAFIDRFRNAYRPIVYSKFGVDKCREVGLECWYVPMGVDTNVFKPRNAAYKAKQRQWLGLREDSFVVGVVAANKDPMDRKGFSDIFEGFSHLLSKHPNSELYIHSLHTGEYGGPDLIEMAKTYKVAEQTRFTTRTTFFKGLTR